MRRSKEAIARKELTKLNKLFVQVAGTYAEYLKAKATHDILKNVFGRMVNAKASSSLAQLQGIAASGIRSAALISAKEAKEQISVLAAFSRQHIPLSALIYGDGYSLLPELAKEGIIVFQAGSAQEICTRLLMAQVISEKALRPVVVLLSAELDSYKFELPPNAKLVEFLGDPDELTKPKNKAQELVFGKRRKRMPAWFNTDLPLNIGIQKDKFSKSLEHAANQLFIDSDLQLIIDETIGEYDQLIPTSKTAATLDASSASNSFYGSEKAEHLVISTGDFSPFSARLAPMLKKGRTAVLVPTQLYPILKINSSLKRLKSLTIIEPASSSNQQGFLFKEFAALPEFRSLHLSNGWYSRPLDAESYSVILQNANLGSKGLARFWVDVPVNVAQSQFPKHQILLQQLARLYPESQEASLTPVLESTQSSAEKIIPQKLKAYTDKGPSYSRLSRFYDDTACFYESNNDEVVADPYQAFPVVPAATAHFINQKREEIPVFDPLKCDQIDSFIAACPHGAMPSSLVTLDAILKNSIKQANARGEKIALMVPQLRNLVKNANAIALKKHKEIGSLSDYLPEAFEKTLKGVKLEDEKKEKLKREFEAVMRDIKDVPFALTDSLFLDREKREAGTGELFTFAVDPSACTGCGVCAAACTDGSVTMSEYIGETEKNLAKQFADFENLPDTSGDTIERLIDDPDSDPLPALMLSRYFYTSITAGSVDDEYAAEKSILRMFAALAEQALQPNIVSLQKKISTQITQLNTAVKKILADALPVTHLDSLMEVLDEKGEGRLSLDRVINEWGQQEAFKTIDKEMLQRKLHLIEDLKEWKWSITEGMSGAGRTRYSVVLDESMSWAAQYPWNNFTVPVILAEKGKAAQTALGVYQGQLRHALDQIKLLRRAELEAKNKYDPTVHNYQIAGLNWSQLSDEEKQSIPAVFVLGKQTLLSEGSNLALNQCLESKYPINFLLLDDAAPNPETVITEMAASANAFWPLMANTNTIIARASLADPRDLFNAFLSALKSGGTSLLSVLCPHAFNHTSDPQHWRPLSQLAVNARAFNPIQYKPNLIAKGAETSQSFNMKMETTALPNIDQDWQEVQLKHIDDEEEMELTYTATWADWAFSLLEWKAEFQLTDPNDHNLPVADYIKLDDKQRFLKIPVILRVNKKNAIQHYAVSDRVIAGAEVAQRSFALLKEISGLHSDFPEKLEKKVTKSLSASFEKDKTELLGRVAKEKEEWEADHLQKMKEQIKARLMQLQQK